MPLAHAVLVMSAAEVIPPMPVAPDAAMIAAYADMVFGWCEGWVAVRALAEKGGPDRAPHTPFLPADAELPAKRRHVEARDVPPSSFSDPPVASKNRSRRDRIVVFPQPVGPMMATVCPGRT